MLDWPELLILAVQSVRLAWRRGRSPGWPVAAGKSLGAGQNSTEEDRKERKDRIDNGRVQHGTRNPNNL